MIKTDTDSGKQPEDDLYPGKQYQNLFNYISKELGKSLLQSEMDEIISIVHKDFPSGEQGVRDERIKEEAIMFATWVENNGYIRFDKYYWTNDDCETRLSDEQLYHKYYLLIKK